MPVKKQATTKIKSKSQNNEILGVLLLGFGVFLFLSIFTESAGLIGQSSRIFMSGLFGIFHFIIPLLFIAFGLTAIFPITKFLKLNHILAVLFVFFTVKSMYQIFHIELFSRNGLLEFIMSSYTLGTQGLGSGVIVAPLVFAFYIVFGRLGSLTILAALIIIAVLFTTNLSINLTILYFLKAILSIKNIPLPFRKKAEDSAEGSNDSISVRKTKNFSGEDINMSTPKSEKIPDLSMLKQTFEKKSQSESDSEIKVFDFADNKTKSDKDLEVQVPETVSEKTGLPVSSKYIGYTLPPLSLLKSLTPKKSPKQTERDVLSSAELLEETLLNFGIVAKVVQISKGPTITRYELQPAPGVKVSRIVGLSDDIALSLAAKSVRIEAPIPGKAAIGIEIPNEDTMQVNLKEVLESEKFSSSPSKLVVALGKDIAGVDVIADISTMPHLLIAGATGSGKSVCINTLIISILCKATPEDVKILMIDPKVVELNNYNGIPHLLLPVVTDPKKAAGALNWVVQEMNIRYNLFAERKTRDLERFNESIFGELPKLPQILVIIDELADLMMVAPADVEDAICRLAQMARAAGIHLVIATQRPSVDVITGLIKANIPSRISFAVSSQIDSRTILDMGGAEKLLGKGDMLFYPMDYSKPIRIQGAYVSEKEVEAIVNHLKSQSQGPSYNETLITQMNQSAEFDTSRGSDELLPEAIEVAIEASQVSISFLQRRLRVGYSRAARLIDEMEARGLISGADGSKPRNVFVTKEQLEDLKGGII